MIAQILLGGEGQPPIGSSPWFGFGSTWAHYIMPRRSKNCKTKKELELVLKTPFFRKGVNIYPPRSVVFFYVLIIAESIGTFSFRRVTLFSKT